MDRDDMVALMTSVLLSGQTEFNLNPANAAPRKAAQRIAEDIYEATHRQRREFAPEPGQAGNR